MFFIFILSHKKVSHVLDWDHTDKNVDAIGWTKSFPFLRCGILVNSRGKRGVSQKMNTLVRGHCGWPLVRVSTEWGTDVLFGRKDRNRCRLFHTRLDEGFGWSLLSLKVFVVSSLTFFYCGSMIDFVTPFDTFSYLSNFLYFQGWRRLLRLTNNTQFVIDV